MGKRREGRGEDGEEGERERGERERERKQGLPGTTTGSHPGVMGTMLFPSY